MGLKQKSALYLLIASFITIMASFLVLTITPTEPVSAAVGINSQLSFEGKIVNSNGTNLSNGTYNMQFKIYQDGNNVGSGSTLKWTENRLVGGSGGVTLVDGTFHVNLGSVTTFGSSVDWNQDTLWLSMQIGNTSSCTITTSFLVDCSGDGEMTPYIRLTAVPYANNSAALGGLVAGNFVQLAQGMQTDSSTTNSSIAINKTGGTANILQLQKSSSDIFVINNTGRITLQPAVDLTSGQTHVTQAFTNGSSSGGTINGYTQTITISNTSSASTSNGINISLTDNTAASLANNNTGLTLSISGSNTSQNQLGIDVSVNRGFGIKVISSGASGAAMTCGNNNFSGNIALCADATTGVGVYARGSTGNGGLATQSGSAVIGVNTNTGSGSSYYAGVKGIAAQSGNGATYTSVGVYGEGRAGTGSTVYGGYFTIASASSATTGSALFASNDNEPVNILQLQDNTVDVMVVQDGGTVKLGTASTASAINFAGSGNVAGTIRKTMPVTGTVAANDVVVIDSTAGGNVTTTTTASDPKVFGIATSASTPQEIVTSGTYQVNLLATNVAIAPGDFLVTTTTAGKVDKSTSPTAGSVLGRALEVRNPNAGGTIWVSVTPGIGGSDGVGATNLDDAYNQAAGTGNTITLTAAGDGLIVQDAATTVGGNLFAVQENSANGGSSLFAVTTTAILMETLTGADALTLDTSTSTPELRIHGSTDTEYVRIWFDSATDTAYFGASVGTAVLGSGTGAVNVTAGAGAGFVITGNAASSVTTNAGDLDLDATAGSSLINIGTGTNSKTVYVGSTNTSSVQNIYIGSNGHASAATSTVLGTTFGTGSTTVKGGSGGINVQSAGTLSLTSGTTTSVTVDSGTTGNVVIGATNSTNAKNVAVGNNNAGSTVDIDGGSGATGIEIGNTNTAHGIQIGSNATGDNDILLGGANAGSTLILEAGTNASAIQIGNGATAHGIQIGTGAAIQTIVIGSTNSTSKLTLQGGVITTTTNNSGIIIGGGFSTSDTSLTPLTLDSDSTYNETASTCSASVNGGSLYYNTAANVMRACVNGGWEDMVSTAGLGLQLFGVVPDSGANPGDLASVTSATNINGPCRVSVGGTTSTVSWTACTAYSGGRKVIVTAGTTTTASGTSATIIWQHLCLTGTNSQPALTTINTEPLGQPTFSVTSPILCLADIRVTNGSAVITQIYDTRTYTITSKEPVSIQTNTAVPALGLLVQLTTTKGVYQPTAAANANGLTGVIVATTGVTATTTINAIIASNGPAAVKSITGTNAVGAYLFSSATAGYAITVATKPAEAISTIYNLIGAAKTAWTNACATSSNACAGGILTSIDKR